MGSFTIAISILALLVSAATSFFAYRQAKSTRDQAKAALEQAEAASKALEIERERWRVERTPDLKGVIKFVSPTGHRLELCLLSDEVVTVLSMRFVGSDGVEFIDAEKEADCYGSLDPVKPLWCWVRVSDPYPTKTRLEVTCRGTKLEDKWIVPIDVSVFPELDERRPMLDIKLRPNYPPPHYMELKLKSSEPLKSLDTTIVGGSGVRFLRPNDQLTTKVTSEALDPGQNMRWPIAIEREHSDNVDLNIRCTGRQEERWYLRERIAVPSELTRPGKPKFQAQIQKEGSEHQLKLKLRSLWPLSSIEVEINDDTGVEFVGDDGARRSRKTYGKLLPDETVTWRIDFGEFVTPFFDLDIVCTGQEGERWKVHKSVDVPPILRKRS